MIKIAPKIFPIDSIENIIVEKEKYHNQIGMLVSLRNGLTELYNICKTTENEVFQKYNAPVSGYNVGMGKYVSNEFYTTLPCYFHWFSVSLYNYSRLCAFVIGLENGKFTKADMQTPSGKKKIKNFCDTYCYSIPELKNVITYRHKVAAHFALTEAPSENFVTMDFSAINITGFVDGKLVSKALQTAVFHNNGIIAEEIPVWSITQVYEILIPRYWPDIKLQTT